MPCALTQDYFFACDVGNGGVKDVYLIELENIASLTESSGTLTAITKVTGKFFRKYQLVQETANFDESIVGNLANGTLFYDQKGVIIINRQQVAVRNEILLLAKNRLVIVTVDNLGNNKLYGRLNGLRLMSGTIATGTTWADRNGYVLNFDGKEKEAAPFVLDTVVAALQTPG